MSGISGAESVRAAAACAGTDSEGTSVQVWMNYEPTQKNIKIVRPMRRLRRETF